MASPEKRLPDAPALCRHSESWGSAGGDIGAKVINHRTFLTRERNMSDRYCVATCHGGTDFGVFKSGPNDEQLTLEEAKKVAGDHGQGYFVLDCTPEEYWSEKGETS